MGRASLHVVASDAASVVVVAAAADSDTGLERALLTNHSTRMPADFALALYQLQCQISLLSDEIIDILCPLVRG